MAFFDPFGGSGSGGSGGGSGAPGKDGRGISSIVFVSSTGGSIAGIAGATDTYRINYTDGTTSTYTIKNGNNGEQGPKGEPGENLTNIAYGTCTTAGDTAGKVVAITENPNWKLQVGSIVVVKFSYTNTAQNPTLNVNGTGAKSIWYNTALVTTSSLAAAGAANRYIKYFYDGTQFVWLGQSFDNSNTYSNASLGQVYGICTTSKATTAKTVAQNGYVLSTGGIVAIKFTNAVPAGSTLNINGKGAKAIYHKGSAITDGVIKAEDTATFIYSGQYHLIAIDRDAVSKEYVDSKVTFYDGIVHRSTNTDTTNCWVKIAECEAPNSTAQIMDEITLYPKTTDSAVKTTCKVRVEGKGAYDSTWKLHIIDSTKDFDSNKVKLIYDKNIVDDKRKIELWGYNINGWDGFYSQKTFGNTSTLTHGLKCLTSQDKFKTTYLHDDFVEAPTIDISIKSLVNEGLTSLENDIAINRTTLGMQCKNLLKPIGSITRAGITYTVNEDGSVTLTGASTTGSTYNYFSIPITLKPGKYKVNGMPETSKTNTYRVDLRANESGGTTYGYGAKEFEVEFTETTTAYYMIRIDGTYKEELGGVTFYPMIRYADIIDDTYEPYKENIDERLTKIQNKIGDIESILSSIVEVS